MKKIKYVYVLFGLFFFSMVTSISVLPEYANAWGNGWSYTCGNTPYQDPSLYNYVSNYGTHDWIAESALIILYKFYPQNQFIRALETDNRNLRKYFLFGTEIPDLRSQYRLLQWTVRTDCGTINYNEIKLRAHDLRYNGPGYPPNDNLMRSTKEAAQKASEAFSVKDCQKAAFFLGVMCHFIADAAYYPHLISNTNPEQSYRTKVYYVTDEQYSTNNRMNEFFNIDEAYNAFLLHQEDVPKWATFYAGLDVRYGNLYQLSYFFTQYRNAIWLDQEAPISNTAGNLGHWDFNSVIDNWDFSNRPAQQGDAKDYFDTVEHNLNVAVYYCATAMKYIINDYIGCECTSPNQDMKKSLSKMSSRYKLLFSWLTLGTMSYLLSLGLPNLLELIISKKIVI